MVAFSVSNRSSVKTLAAFEKNADSFEKIEKKP
jgi:hypothetical protein